MTTIVIPATAGNFSPALPQPPFAGQPSFVQRRLQVSVTLTGNNPVSGQPNTFAGTGSDTVTFDDVRASARVTMSGTLVNTADISVYGLDQSLMNEMSALGRVYQWVPFNELTLSAGLPGGGYTPVFAGHINMAFPDYNQQPDVPFRFICQAGQAYRSASVQPTSYAGQTNVADIMSGFARLMGVRFENDGITSTLYNPYYRGSLWEQVQKCADDAHVNAQLVDGASTLAIWPIGGQRSTQSQQPPLLSAATGMIGYPTFAPNGWIIVKTLFNPQVTFGATVAVESILPLANQNWIVQQMDLFLETMVPYGRWEATIQGMSAMYPQPVPATGGTVP